MHTYDTRGGRRGRARAWSRSGFTITELMIVVMIIAVLSAVGMSTTGNNRAERATRNTVARVADTLVELRSRAMLTGRAMVVQIDHGAPRTGHVAQIAWYESSDNLCANAPATVTGRVAIDHRDTNGDYGLTTISDVAPLSPGYPMSSRFCVLPSGRVVDPSTNRPVQRVGASRYDGRIWMRVSDVRCHRGVSRCENGPLGVIMAIDYTGLVEQLAPGTEMP